MARGKQTCKILKEIRRQIAEANDIEFITSECRYKGDCLGTCPKCEAEVRYLEQQLRARSLAGKAVALAGISAGMILMSGCSGTSSNSTQSDEPLQGEPPCQITPSDTLKKEDINTDSLIENTTLLTNLPIVGGILDDTTDVCDENGIYDVADTPPQFPGGVAAERKFLCANLKFPDESFQNKLGILDKVEVVFYVDTLGHVCDPRVARGLDSELDEEALRVVRLFPNFVPASHKGKKVKIWYSVSVSFKFADYEIFID